jgi:hypothetical protein
MCACCGTATMVTVRLLPPHRGPPPWQDPAIKTCIHVPH